MTDRRQYGTERRSGRERRRKQEAVFFPFQKGDFRFPAWHEQVIQFLTRYLFVALGFIYFHSLDEVTPLLLPADRIGTLYLVYVILNTAFFLHAWRHPFNTVRYRLAMWLDIFTAGVSLLNDPYDIPPSLLVFIMIVLGNGMRYGMRLFAEALVGSFGMVMLVLTLRHGIAHHAVTPGMFFLNLFGGIILVYAYILMSRIERNREQLEMKSRFDSLTGLLNRRGLHEIADQIFDHVRRTGQPIVVLFADLDKFKSINDKHGHALGDRVLRRFADIINGNLRKNDIAARLGGDEFILFLQDTSLEEACRIAERLQSRTHDAIRDPAVPFSVTIGIGEIPTHGKTLAEILERVDHAMYRGKTGATKDRIVVAEAAA